MTQKFEAPNPHTFSRSGTLRYPSRLDTSHKPPLWPLESRTGGVPNLRCVQTTTYHLIPAHGGVAGPMAWGWWKIENGHVRGPAHRCGFAHMMIMPNVDVAETPAIRVNAHVSRVDDDALLRRDLMCVAPY